MTVNRTSFHAFAGGFNEMVNVMMLKLRMTYYSCEIERRKLAAGTLLGNTTKIKELPEIPIKWLTNKQVMAQLRARDAAAMLDNGERIMSAQYGGMVQLDDSHKVNKRFKASINGMTSAYTLANRLTSIRSGENGVVSNCFTDDAQTDIDFVVDQVQVMAENNKKMNYNIDMLLTVDNPLQLMPQLHGRLDHELGITHSNMLPKYKLRGGQTGTRIILIDDAEEMADLLENAVYVNDEVAIDWEYPVDTSLGVQGETAVLQVAVTNINVVYLFLLQHMVREVMIRTTDKEDWSFNKG